MHVYILANHFCLQTSKYFYNCFYSQCIFMRVKPNSDSSWFRIKCAITIWDDSSNWSREEILRETMLLLVRHDKRPGERADWRTHGLGESAGVNRFEDKSLAGSIRIVPPTLIMHKRPRTMRQMDEPARFTRPGRIEETGQDKHWLIGNPLRWMDNLLSGIYAVLYNGRRSRARSVDAWTAKRKD